MDNRKLFATRNVHRIFYASNINNDFYRLSDDWSRIRTGYQFNIFEKTNRKTIESRNNNF